MKKRWHHIARSFSWPVFWGMATIGLLIVAAPIAYLQSWHLFSLADYFLMGTAIFGTAFFLTKTAQGL